MFSLYVSSCGVTTTYDGEGEEENMLQRHALKELPKIMSGIIEK